MGVRWSMIKLIKQRTNGVTSHAIILIWVATRTRWKIVVTTKEENKYAIQKGRNKVVMKKNMRTKMQFKKEGMRLQWKIVGEQICSSGRNEVTLNKSRKTKT
jgi:hypothetical protein